MTFGRKDRHHRTGKPVGEWLLRKLQRTLLAFGISEKEVAVMLQKNPATLMSLDEQQPPTEDSWHAGRTAPRAA